MSDDIREAAAQRMARLITDDGGGHMYDYLSPTDLDRLADAAIEAATPYIEAALIERLAAMAEDYNGTVVWRYETDDFSPEDGSLADWLRAQGGQE